jgi:glycine cleavage system transcriptional repressor
MKKAESNTQSSFFLLTASGKDSPGLVAYLTRIVFEAGGNIEDASMTRLGGEFAMMFVIWLPAGIKSPKLKESLEAVGKESGLSIYLKPIPESLAHREPQPEAQFLISVYGTDKPGIVYKVTQALADRQINITDLNTRSVQRNGKPIYVMLLEVQAPQNLRLNDLREELNRLGRELGIEISLQDMEPVEL